MSAASPTTLPVPRGVTRAQLRMSADPWIAGSTVALLAIGTIMVYSASAVRSFDQGGSTTAYLLRHAVSIAVGLCALWVAGRVPVERWSRHAYVVLGLAVALLIAVYVPGLGRRVNGAVRWLSLGPMVFQPAELAKLAVVVYLAHSLAKKREKVRIFSIGFVPHLAVTGGIVLLLLFQPDFGTSAILFAILGLMMFVAGTRIGYLLLAAVLASPLALAYVASRPHAMERLLVFMNPEAHRSDAGYQIYESLVSIGSGGALGMGLGAGRQKLYFLPEAHTDFVFAVVGEELGFLGVILVLALFAVLVSRGIRLAMRASCRFEMLLAFGLSTWFGVQALFNMAVVLALAPTKGLTLPFVSYGGSSQVVALFAVGILLRISSEQVCLSKEKTK